MRSALIIGVLLLTGCPRPGVDQCEPAIVAPEGVAAPAGSTTEVTVRFFNPTAKPLHVTQLELAAGAPFSFRFEPKDFTVEPGSCERPNEVGLVLRFAPTKVGRVEVPLQLQLEGAATTIALSGMGTGPLLSAAGVVNFGYLGLAPSAARELDVRNIGTMGTSLEVSVTSVTATSPNTTEQELCIGRLERGACVPMTRVTVSREAAFPLVVVPRSAGGKTWNVEVRAGTQSFVVRVIANVVDTRRCQLTAIPARLAFGAVLAPATDTRSTVLRNVGADPCVLLQATTSDPQFRVLNWPMTSQLLPASGSLEVKAQASLTSTRGATGTLTFELAPTTDGGGESFSIPVDATPPASCLVLTPDPLDFGVVRTGCSTPARAVTLYNVCERPLLISRFTVDPPFTLVSGPSAPLSLTQGQPVAVTISAMPVSMVGAVTSALRVTLHDGEDTFLGLTARMEPHTQQTDVFRFDERALVDLVLVLDDSPSFARQHAHVRSELSRMSAWVQLQKPNINTRIAVTTTDVTNNGPRGRFRTTDGGVRWAAGDDSSFSSTFDELTRLTTTGAEHQSCIEAAARAVTEPLASDPQGNGGFHRPRGVTSVVCITDDLENSTTPEAWRAQLQALDAGQRFSYSVVGPFGSTCSVDALDEGGTHAANVTPFWGITTDVCGPWELYSIGGFGGGQRTTFFLTSTPVPSSLEVVFDGVRLPAQSGSWRYDAASNAVIMDPNVLGLDPRSLIITYENPCP
ncbi:MAG: hypothetical protein JNM69_09775 [Archangium sp.]|nr:hypothetical protein [Archangium sp.]